MATATQPREQERGLSSFIEQDQGLSSSIAFQAYIFFLTILSVFVQVKFQGNGVSPSKEHNVIMSSFVVVISIYVGTIILGKKFELQTTGPIRLLSGTIAPVLLLLVLVPKFGWLLLVLWVFLGAKMVQDYLQQLYHYLLYQASGQVSNLFAILMTPNSTSVEDSPV